MLGQPTIHTPQASAPLLAFDSSFRGISSGTPAFGPSSRCNGVPADINLITADRILFYAHRQVLLHASTNAFAGLLATDEESITVPEPSDVLAIALHVVYGLPCVHLSPPWNAVESAVAVLVKYGVPIQNSTAQGLPLSELVLSHAPYRPIDAYALAAHYGLEELAVAVSAHLLGYDLSNLTDELSIKMGPLYAKRLFDLHQTRRDALRNIVMTPPAMHQPNLACGTGEQGRLTQAWASVAVDLAWNAVPSTSIHMLQSLYDRAGKNISCGECRVMLDKRIQEAMEQWSRVKRTI